MALRYIDGRPQVIVLTHRAFVPTVHLSDLGSKASRAKYKVGQEVRGRVLERDAASKRIVMTLKKALVGSKLPAIVHLEVCCALHCDRCTVMHSSWRTPLP